MGHYAHISFEERKVIQKRQWAGIKVKSIAEELHRDPSTILREIKRNISSDGFYRAYEAHQKYRHRCLRYDSSRIEKALELKLYILEKLFFRWSPEYIAGRLKIDFPDDEKMRISYESIYQWIYNAYHQDGIELWRYLPRKRRKRRNRVLKKQPRFVLQGKKSIHSRPEAVDSKCEIGHWEGDTVVGKSHDGFTVTLLERKTQLFLTAWMPDKRAETCVRAIVEAFDAIPNKMIKTITFDNGVEFSNFKIIEELLECEVYFADPYSAWQRGSNERSNGLLRRFYPKGTSFKNLSEKELAIVQSRINAMPRKALGYFTPHETFFRNALRI